jgi:hypothetical protein
VISRRGKHCLCGNYPREASGGRLLLQETANDRISAGQLDELVGVARGLVADGVINQDEVEFLENWLIANRDMSDLPAVNTLYRRVREIMADGIADDAEREELLETLHRRSGGDLKQLEALRGNALPLCSPAPALAFPATTYCFTGIFNYGRRRLCEEAVIERGALASGLNSKTNVLVIGMYTTDIWQDSTIGSTISNAVEYRRKGVPISIVSEVHWRAHL